MLLIETVVKLSPNKGLGLFAKHFIKKGTAYWIRNESFDKVITPENLESLLPIAKEYIERYACLEKNGNWYLCGDNGRFSNHSDISNTRTEFNEDGLVISLKASRDIHPEEEIFCNYTELCHTCIDGVVFKPL